MNLSRTSSPHQHIRRSTGQVMRLVIYAAVPGLLVQTWFFGWGAILHFGIAATVALVTEALILEMRKRDFEAAIKDSSALLTALLIAISIPPLAPWWITAIGTFFAIAMVKQLYGGLGYNPFNPAMAAYVMLLISFPVQMTNWLPPVELSQYSYGLIDSAYVIFTGFSSEGYSITQLRTDVDGITLATPLDEVKTALISGLTFSEIINSSIFAGDTGKGWFWVNVAYLLGGLALLRLKIIKWQIPIAMITSVLILSAVMHAVDSDQFASPAFHLFSGGLMLGAFFIATDPVSASTTDKGRLYFGAGIGIWIFVIRTWGGYPEAVAFAVLIMNMAVPLIDYYTRPRTYGHQSEHKKHMPEKVADKE